MSGPRPMVQGDGFSVPLPAGFEFFSKEAIAGMEQGGVVFAQSESAGLKERPRASIVISPLPYKGLNLRDSQMCLSMAPSVAQSLDGELLGTDRVVRPVGSTCEVVVSKAERGMRAKATLIGSAARVWMVTCNYDRMDGHARDGCDALLEGFVLDPEELAQR